MNTIELPIERLHEARWNANAMDPATLQRLKYSVSRYGLVENLVVRAIGMGAYEVLSGNQRLQVLADLGWKMVPCVVMELTDAEARLLAQALNHIHGVDDPGLRAELLQEVLQDTPREEVLALLPETTRSLEAMSNLTPESLAQYLGRFEQTRKFRLKHFLVQLTTDEHLVVEAAVKKFLPRASLLKNGNPNLRGNAIYLICKEIMDQEEAT